MILGEKKATYRILSLHGIGTNSEILELQTSSLRYQLGPEYEFTFVDGAHPWPAAAGVESAYGDALARNCFSYYDGTASSAVEAVRDLASYICENGPYDCVAGFSLGASMIGTLLFCQDPDPELQEAKSMIESVVFLCGILPQRWESLERGEMEEIRPGDVPPHEMLSIRAVHAWSPQDMQYAKQGEMLAGLFAGPWSLELTHSAGHSVPRETSEVVALAEAVKRMIAE
ncbi:hypothetical protein V2G26_013808 [Clonostachys chloroleuca]